MTSGFTLVSRLVHFEIYTRRSTSRMRMFFGFFWIYRISIKTKFCVNARTSYLWINLFVSSSTNEAHWLVSCMCAYVNARQFSVHAEVFLFFFFFFFLFWSRFDSKWKIRRMHSAQPRTLGNIYLYASLFNVHTRRSTKGENDNYN